MTTQRRQPTLTEIRHGSLRHHLGDSEADLVATDTWVVGRIHHYAAIAGVAPVEAFTDPASYSSRTGRRISPNCWGQADWGSGRLVYVDPARCRTRAAAELVTAHEIGHLRWPTARHTAASPSTSKPCSTNTSRGERACVETSAKRRQKAVCSPRRAPPGLQPVPDRLGLNRPPRRRGGLDVLVTSADTGEDGPVVSWTWRLDGGAEAGRLSEQFLPVSVTN